MDIKKTVKIAMIFSIFAFVLSVFLGVIGSGFWLFIILRALLFALIFAGLGVGTFYIYDRFLQVADFSFDEKTKASKRGNRVDLVSEDDYNSDSSSDEKSTQAGSSSPDLEDGVDNDLLLADATSDIDLESVGNLGSSMTDLDELGENFDTMGELDLSNDLGESVGEHGLELGESSAASISMDYINAGSSGGGGFSSDVTLEDIGGPESTPQDYAKAVRTLIKKDE